MTITNAFVNPIKPSENPEPKLGVVYSTTREYAVQVSKLYLEQERERALKFIDNDARRAFWLESFNNGDQFDYLGLHRAIIAGIVYSFYEFATLSFLEKKALADLAIEETGKTYEQLTANGYALLKLWCLGLPVDGSIKTT